MVQVQPKNKEDSDHQLTIEQKITHVETIKNRYIKIAVNLHSTEHINHILVLLALSSDL